MTKVSVIIPVYNSAPVLRLTIDAVLSQSYSLIEVIIVDDGSSDKSLEVARSYTDNRIIVITQKNAGAAVARNSGLKIASGDYIQFLDAGDCISPNKIEKQLMVLTENPEKLAVCDYIKFNNPDEIGQKLGEDQTSFIYSSNEPTDFLANLWGANGQSNFIQTNSWLVPRSLIDKAGYWREYRCPDDDGEFFARIILSSNGIIHVPGVYNYYHVGVGANFLSGNKNRKYIQNVLLTIDLKSVYLTQKDYSYKIQKAIAMQYLFFAVYNYPAFRLYSAIAYKRYKSFNIKLRTPKIGGIFFETTKFIFGWKCARFIRYFSREKNK